VGIDDQYGAVGKGSGAAVQAIMDGGADIPDDEDAP